MDDSEKNKESKVDRNAELLSKYIDGELDMIRLGLDAKLNELQQQIRAQLEEENEGNE